MSGEPVFVITVADTGNNAADILIIDDELHDVDSVVQPTMNQNDVCDANRMLVLPERVSFQMLNPLTNWLMANKCTFEIFMIFSQKPNVMDCFSYYQIYTWLRLSA